MTKTKRNRKWKIPHSALESRTLCFSSYKNRELKVNLWRVGACERKKSAFFVFFTFSEEICVLSQYRVHLTNFQNIYELLHVKKQNFTHFFSFLSLTAFSVSLNKISFMTVVFLSVSMFLIKVWNQWKIYLSWIKQMKISTDFVFIFFYTLKIRLIYIYIALILLKKGKL